MKNNRSELPMEKIECKLVYYEQIKEKLLPILQELIALDYVVFLNQRHGYLKDEVINKNIENTQDCKNAYEINICRFHLRNKIFEIRIVEHKPKPKQQQTPYILCCDCFEKGNISVRCDDKSRKFFREYFEKHNIGEFKKVYTLAEFLSIVKKNCSNSESS